MPAARGKFAKKHMMGPDGPLGEVDVLIAVPADRRLIAVEAKDMAGSLTPSDLACQLETTFGTGIKKRSSGEKHARRVAWLMEHRAEVLTELGLDDPGAESWAVEGVFVTSQALPVGSVKGLPMPVLSLDDLRTTLAHPPAERPSKSSRRRRRR